MITQLLGRYRRVLALLVPRAVVWGAALLALALLLVGPTLAGAVLAMATVVFLTWWRLSRVGADRQLGARGLLAVGLAVGAAREQGWDWPLLTVLVLVAGVLLVEPIIGRVSRPSLLARNLPGLVLPAAARVREPAFLGVGAALVVIALGTLGLPAAWLLVLAGGVALAGLAVAGYQLVRARRHAPEREIRAALTGYGPRYCLYYNGIHHGAYQVRMWLPYLERTGERGVLVIRDQRFLAAAAELTDLPVVLARSVESLEYVAVPSVGAFFYVNNDARNVDGVRFGGLTHVHLGHGDSDKPASYAATTAMFDRIFVAGRAGVDRFAKHGVLVPREKFELVGRPQVEQIEVRGADAPLPEQPVVLYAPTWRGSLQDSLFGSLRAGERIVSGLLAAGATVWFRPHPYSARDAESRVLIKRIDTLLAADAARPHLTSEQTARRSILDCMNASHAMVTDISSVASDYLYSNKPFALTDPGLADLAADYPLVGAAVRLPLDGDPAGPIAELLGGDSRREERAELRRYYLGDWPPEEYAGVFVAAARAAMTGPAERAETDLPPGPVG